VSVLKCVTKCEVCFLVLQTTATLEISAVTISALDVEIPLCNLVDEQSHFNVRQEGIWESKLEVEVSVVNLWFDIDLADVDVEAVKMQGPSGVILRSVYSEIIAGFNARLIVATELDNTVAAGVFSDVH
jgi:hypothetical protein